MPHTLECGKETEKMNAEMKAKLEKLAARKCWSDNEDFMVDDYAGGNIDDAYYGGNTDGETDLARELLAEFGGHNVEVRGCANAEQSNGEQNGLVVVPSPPPEGGDVVEQS